MAKRPILLTNVVPNRWEQIRNLLFAAAVFILGFVVALSSAVAEWIAETFRRPRRLAFSIFTISAMLMAFPILASQCAGHRMAGQGQRVERVAERYAKMQTDYFAENTTYAVGPECCAKLATFNGKEFPKDLRCSCESDDPTTSITLGVWRPKSGLRKGCIWLISPERGPEKLYCR